MTIGSMLGEIVGSFLRSPLQKPIPLNITRSRPVCGENWNMTLPNALAASCV